MSISRESSLDFIAESLLLSVVNAKDAFPVSSSLIQAVCLEDIGEREDIFLEAGAAPGDSSVKEWHANSLV